jgi:hypothetical protein
LYQANDLVFAADTSDTVDAIRTLTFRWGMEKHLLFSPIAHGMYRVLAFAGRCSGYGCIPSTLAACASVNVVACYSLLRALARTRRDAARFTALYALAFGNLVIFSIPETYVVTGIGILLVLRLMLDQRWFASTPPVVAAGGIGVLALNNPPLLSLVAPLLWCYLKTRRCATAVAVVGCVVAALTVFVAAETAINGPRIWGSWQQYAAEWADTAHLVSPSAIAASLSGLLGYGMLSPAGAIGPSAPLSDVAAYSASVPRLTAFAMYLSLLVSACAGALRRGPAPLQALVGWSGAMVLFHVYFNPTEAFLYSPQLTGALTVLLLCQHERFADTTLRAVTPLFIVLLAWNNVGALHAQ